MRRLRPADLGDGRNNYARQQAAVDQVVLGRVSDGDALQRHLGPATAEPAWPRLVPNRLDVVRQATPGHGQPGARATVRRRRGRRDDRALFPLARLRDIHAPDVRCPISLAVNGSEHRLYPFPEGLLCLRHGLAVHPWSRALRNLTQIRPYSFSCDVMGQGSEPQFWFTSCFRCYSFESCSHGWFIFSLHRSSDLSLDRAHVSLEQFIFCWPLPHVAGSPDRGVLSASLTSTRPSDLPRLASLSGPTGFRLNLMDLLCSHEILWLHAGGTNPGSLPDAHRVVPGNTAFPIGR